MDRRNFMKSMAMAGLGMAFPKAFSPLAHAALPEKSDLAVVSGSSPRKITQAAIEAVGGITSFISRGDIVVVKPNIGWDRRPEQAATTNPEVVATLVELCFDGGAKKVKVFDRSVPDPRRCYKQSGIAEAAAAAGAEVSFMDERKFREVKIDGLALKEWPFYTEALDADKIINVPIAKQHGSATLTLGMKNWMGVIGGRRGKIHFSMDKNLVDLSSVMRPTLVVLDAVRILTRHGPQGGDLEDVKTLDTVVAGTDQVAVDAYGATLFSLKGSDLGYVRLAHENGLGTMDLSRLTVQTMQL